MSNTPVKGRWTEPAAAGAVRSILVVSLSNIGDAVLTTPVLERLHQLYPDARMDILGDRRSSALFTHCPYRGEIIHRDKAKGWRGRLALVRALRRTRYDLIVDLRTDGMAYLLRAGRRLTKWHRGPHGAHAVEDHMAVIAAINPAGLIPPATLWVSDAEVEAAVAALQPLRASGTGGTRWLAVAPGANWPPKTWPAARFAELIAQVSDRFDGVVLLGGPDDRERCEAIGLTLTLPSVDLAGRTDLLQAAAVLGRCRAFVGNDSGLGHMAAAVGLPTVTVFGPGRPERYHPWGPCSIWRVSETGHIEDLAAAPVAAALCELLDCRAPVLVGSAQGMGR